MTTQEAYEMMRVYLTRPGARRAFEGDTCMYETVIDQQTHRCAIGCLLTPNSLNQTRFLDEEYVELNFESGDQGGEHVRLADLRGGLATIVDLGYNLPELDDVDLAFLESAQGVHDNQRNWMGGKFAVEALDKLADEFGLRVVTDQPVVEGARRELVTA